MKVETAELHHYSNCVSENHQLSDETLQGWQDEGILSTYKAKLLILANGSTASQPHLHVNNKALQRSKRAMNCQMKLQSLHHH